MRIKTTICILAATLTAGLSSCQRVSMGKSGEWDVAIEYVDRKEHSDGLFRRIHFDSNDKHVIITDHAYPTAAKNITIRGHTITASNTEERCQYDGDELDKLGLYFSVFNIVDCVTEAYFKGRNLDWAYGRGGRCYGSLEEQERVLQALLDCEKK